MNAPEIVERVTWAMKLSSAKNLRLLSVLANPIRVEVLSQLAFSEKCVADIALNLELEQSTVSHALRKLLEVELVERAAFNRNRIYRLSPSVKPLNNHGTIELEVFSGQLRVCFQMAKTSLRHWQH